jgi:hypothetical protein
MDDLFHSFSELFAQLGLANDSASIAAFIKKNAPLQPDIRLEDAPFWTPSQAALIKEKRQEDADWTQLIDQLSLSLRAPVQLTS